MSNPRRARVVCYRARAVTVQRIRKSPRCVWLTHDRLPRAVLRRNISRRMSSAADHWFRWATGSWPSSEKGRQAPDLTGKRPSEAGRQAPDLTPTRASSEEGKQVHDEKPLLSPPSMLFCRGASSQCVRYWLPETLTVSRSSLCIFLKGTFDWLDTVCLTLEKKLGNHTSFLALCQHATTWKVTVPSSILSPWTAVGAETVSVFQPASTKQVQPRPGT